jgi:carbon-monoxide dehydrogenase large subunit
VTDTVDTGTRLVGQPVKRKEDARLVTGSTSWTDNIQLPGMLHMAILRSPMAHARIDRIDTSRALGMPGVVAVFTGADTGAAGVPCVWPVTDDIVIPDFPALASQEVRFAGDAVAAVVADTRYHAADALEGVDVEYGPLAPVLDMEAALADGAPLVHSDKGTNKCFYWVLDGGDYAAAKAKAEAEGGRVFHRRYVQQRLIPNAMEPRAVVCAPIAATGEITLWSATQIPHIVRVLLSLSTGIPEHKIRVIAPDVGGGFGSKLEFYREEIIAALVASKLGRPVKWTESRSEGYLATIHGRDQIQDIEIACAADGTFLGLHVELLADMGAYLQIITPGIPLLGAFMYNAIYKFGAYHFGTTGVFSTKTPTDAYRGAGRPEATYAIERIVSDLAAELGMDPLALREKNWITHDEFPYQTISGLEYDSGNYEAATERARELFGYDELRAEQQKRRESGDTVQLGIGVSTYTEMCGLAPSRILSALKYVAGGWESATVRVLPTGKVEVVTGTSPHGQGHVTAWSQIAADALGVPFDDITVIHGDTKMAPNGMDTYGSRSLVIGGMAVQQAAERVVEKARRIAAHQLEADPGDIEFADGTFRVRGTPGTERTIQAVAFEAFTAHDLPEGVEPTLVADSTIDPNVFSYPHGTHLCAAEVDTETGEVRLRSYVAVDDIGNVVNPLIVEGQVHGGVAQGIAQALYEEAVYDAAGNLVTGTRSTTSCRPRRT